MPTPISVSLIFYLNVYILIFYSLSKYSAQWNLSYLKENNQIYASSQMSNIPVNPTELAFAHKDLGLSLGIGMGIIMLILALALASISQWRNGQTEEEGIVHKMRTLFLQSTLPIVGGNIYKWRKLCSRGKPLPIMWLWLENSFHFHNLVLG